jgi:hypothetical protein
MLHPFEKVTPRMFRVRLVGFASATLLLGLVMMLLAREFESRTDAHGRAYGILSFEFAATQARAHAILETWGEQGVRAARIQTWVDFLFLFCYSTALAAGCVWALRRFMRVLPDRPGLVRTGRALAYAMFGAALCDAVENYALLEMLYNGAHNPLYPRLAFICASIKFTLVAAALFYMMAAAAAPRLAATGVRRLRPG